MLIFAFMPWCVFNCEDLKFPHFPLSHSLLCPSSETSPSVSFLCPLLCFHFLPAKLPSFPFPFCCYQDQLLTRDSIDLVSQIARVTDDIYHTQHENSAKTLTVIGNILCVHSTPATWAYEVNHTHGRQIFYNWDNTPSSWHFYIGT